MAQYGTNEVNWGQEFLPKYPDAYLSEDLPRGENVCPQCGRKVLHIKDQDRPYCTSCFMGYKGQSEDRLSETDRAFLKDMMLERFSKKVVADS